MLKRYLCLINIVEKPVNRVPQAQILVAAPILRFCTLIPSSESPGLVLARNKPSITDIDLEIEHFGF